MQRHARSTRPPAAAEFFGPIFAFRAFASELAFGWQSTRDSIAAHPGSSSWRSLSAKKKAAPRKKGNS